MYQCTCGYAAETEGGLMSHFIERHGSSYVIELCCPLGSACYLTGSLGTLSDDTLQLSTVGY